MIRQIIDKFSDGGPFFTVTIFIVLLIVLALFISAFLSKKDHPKIISLMSHFSWFAVAWGFMGRTIGLISAFDDLEAHGEFTAGVLASGLKIALLDPLFGIFVFIVARVFMIILTWMNKKEDLL